ncbi:MAG: hypothetical protein IPH05_09840 [Flavobacteriales bacterium]|nr:hypothetical protein [Flavobacteriales bacterium]
MAMNEETHTKGVKTNDRVVAKPMWNQDWFTETDYANEELGRFPTGEVSRQGQCGGCGACPSAKTSGSRFPLQVLGWITGLASFPLQSVTRNAGLTSMIVPMFACTNNSPSYAPKDQLTKDASREPIEDFVRLIQDAKEDGATPTKFVLNFRDWQISNREEPVYKIRTSFLRFRKDNGRIASDVDSHESLRRP